MAEEKGVKGDVERVAATREAIFGSAKSTTIKVKDLSGLPATLRNSLKDVSEAGIQMSLPGMKRVHISDEQFNNVRSDLLKKIQSELGGFDPRLAWTEVYHSW